MSQVKCLHWIIVAVLFWLAWMVFRLGTSIDIQPGANILWVLGLPVTFALPAVAGYNYAKWRFYRMVHHIGIKDTVNEILKDKPCE